MLSKIERRKIALRNLRKAWITRRLSAKERGIRKRSAAAAKQMHKNPRQKSMPKLSLTVFNRVRNICERHGSEFVLAAALSWITANANKLYNNGYATDSKAYFALADRLYKVRISAKGM